MTQLAQQQINQQVLITCRTHEMIKNEFPEYEKPDCKVEIKKFHTTLGLMNTLLKPSGFQLYIGENVSYQDYLAMLKYLTENPLKENVFKQMQENANQNT